MSYKYAVTSVVLPFTGELPPPPSSNYDWRIKDTHITEQSSYGSSSKYNTGVPDTTENETTSVSKTFNLVCVWFAEEKTTDPKGEEVEKW